MQVFRMSDDSQKRWAAFWENDVYDRPVLMAYAPLAQPDPIRSLPPGKALPAPLDPPQNNAEDLALYKRWFDIDDLILRTLKNAAGYAVGYESTLQPNTGWSVAYCLPFGVKCEYNQYAAWCEPLDGITCASDFDFDFKGKWFEWLHEGTKRMAQAGKNLYYITPVMWGNHSADTLSSMVGINHMMLACMDDPQSVKHALNTVTDAQIQAFAMIRDLEHISELPGSRNYTGTWSPKTTLSFDCDVSAMVSPKMFKDIFLPPLERIMETVDHRIYHLDGPVCLQHLPTLLELPQLQAIQWVPGAGHDNPMDWIDLYAKMQKAGKSVIIYPAYDQVLDICKALSPKGLALSFHCPSEDAMHEIVEKVAALY